MHEIITSDYFPGQNCDCEARSSYECGCDADWTPVEVYKLREDAKQLADRLTALELHSTSELARLEQERDDTLSQIAQAECRAERFCQERDEARDALMKIEDLFIDGTDIYADREKMGLIARNALEGAKMSDRPTPETDQFKVKFKTVCGEKYWVPVDIARKLERERDEARQNLNSGKFVIAQHEVITNLILEHNQALDKLNNLNNKLQKQQCQIIAATP